MQHIYDTSSWTWVSIELALRVVCYLPRSLNILTAGSLVWEAVEAVSHKVFFMNDMYHQLFNNHMYFWWKQSTG